MRLVGLSFATIVTSALPRASTRVFPGYALFRLRSPSFKPKHTNKQTCTHKLTHKHKHNTDNRQHKERPRQTHETTQQRNTKHATRITQDKTSQDKSRQDKCIYIHTYAYINTYLYQYLFLYTYIYIHEARPADISGHLSLINY